MVINKTTLIFSLIGGLLLISLYFIGLKLFYMTGLLIPIFYTITMLLAMFYEKKKKKYRLNFIQLFNISFVVFFGMTLINFLFMVINKSLIWNIQDNLLAFGVTLLLGLLLSVFLAFIFKMIYLRKS